MNGFDLDAARETFGAVGVTPEQVAAARRTVARYALRKEDFVALTEALGINHQETP